MKYDAIVLGKGPLGIYTSYSLVQKGLKVLNIDSGLGLNFLKERIKVNSNILWSDLEKKPSLNTKVTPHMWGGACMGFNQNMFYRKENNLNVLPIKTGSLKDSYTKIAEILDLNEFDFNVNKPTKEISKLNDDNFEMTYAKVAKNIYMEKITNFLKNSENYTFIDNGIAKHIWIEKSFVGLTYLDYPTFETSQKKAKSIYLCLGAIENTRLLLSSNDYLAFNKRFLGKELSDHISFNFARIESNLIEKIKEDFYYKYEDSSSTVWPRLQIKKAISEDSFCYLDVFESKQKKLFNKPSSSANMNLFIGKRVNEESVLSLSGADYIPNLNVKFEIKDEEIEYYKSVVQSYINFFENEYPESKIIRNNILDLDIEKLNTANHPSGTTKMSGKPEEGVVDHYSRLWGYDNIFIFGSSVFPSSSNIHPTFAALALADYSINSI